MGVLLAHAVVALEVVVLLVAHAHVVALTHLPSHPWLCVHLVVMHIVLGHLLRNWRRCLLHRPLACIHHLHQWVQSLHRVLRLRVRLMASRIVVCVLD